MERIEVKINGYYVQYPLEPEYIELAKRFLDACKEALFGIDQEDILKKCPECGSKHIWDHGETAECFECGEKWAWLFQE